MKFFPIKNFCVFVFLVISLPATAAPTLESEDGPVTAGYYQLSWDTEDESRNGQTEYVLQEATDPDFTHAVELYKGPDTATHISGRSNGTYYYRIRNSQDTDSSENWSNVARIDVSHHPLSRAFTFFALGAVVFIATAIAVIVGYKSHKQ